MLDCQLYGRNPGGFHLTNVWLHAATAVLLFLVLRRMTGRVWPSALVAALFAVHPLRPIGGLGHRAKRRPQRAVLHADAGGLCGLCTAPVFDRPLPGGAVCFLGLMAKPMLVTLPCVLLLLDYWPLRRMSNSPLL